MKKLSLILVALATMVMVGCKPLTGCTHIYDDGVVVTEPTCVANGVKTYTCKFCDDKQYESIPATGNHTWVDTDDTKVESVTCGEDGLEIVWVSPKYKCSVCGETHKKADAFFDTDTTIGKANNTSLYNDRYEYWNVDIDEKLTIFNRYYDEVVKNKGNNSWKYYCSCSCDTCRCQEYCTCGPNGRGDLDNCVRSYHSRIYFGGYYITVPNN